MILTLAMLGAMSTGVFAEAPNSINNNEYFTFEQKPRMDSDGSFTFEFSNGLDSDLFIADSSSITMEITATSTEENEMFYVSIAEGWGDELKQLKRVRADGTKKTFKYSNLNVGETYRLVFENDILDAGTTTVTGTGKLSNVTV